LHPKLTPELERLVDLDNRLVLASKQIKVLTSLVWPEETCPRFLDAWNAGNPRLPHPHFAPVQYGDNINELKKIMAACDRAHPVGNYIYLTAESYCTAATMLQNRGNPIFTELSAQLYGRPSDKIGSGGLTHADAATHFIESTRDFIAAYEEPSGGGLLSAEHVVSEMKKVLGPFFKNHPIEVAIDPGLTSKAAAGAQRIRIRGGTVFSQVDIGQLIQHEGLVHMLTMLNGREQPRLKSLGLGSPRTTRTQEGLATFAELITSTIDLSRLQRIALRIRAVQLAELGADFIEVFRFFLDAGQEPMESFQSTARVFRGGDPRGKVIFTKDTVYLQGLIFIHTFLRKALQSAKFRFPAYLFAGRLTLGDVVALEPFFESGFIEQPQYEPPWLQHRQRLAAYLCYAIFANRISLGDIHLQDFLTRDL
jgi:uncharacterized protein (TIGR02421 family)